MAKENEDQFDMSLFADQDLELNLDLAPVDIPTEEENTGEETPAEETNSSIEEETEIIPGESESSEAVAEDEGDDNEGDNQDDSPNLYSSFATVLDEQGLLPSLDLQENKIESLEDLTTAFKSEIETQAKQYLISKIGSEGVEALDKGVSLAEYQQYNQTEEALDSITEDLLSSDIDLAKKVILQDYINQGISESRATRILNKSIEAGDEVVIEDAIESLTSLKAFEANKLEKIAEQRAADEAALEKQQEKIDNDLKNSIYNKDEYLEGYKVNKSMQDKVYKSITEIVGEHNGVAENKLMKQRRENPIDFDTKLYYLFELTNGFTDFSSVSKKTTSSASNALERALRTNRFTDSSQPSFIDDNESYGGIGSELVL